EAACVHAAEAAGALGDEEIAAGEERERPGDLEVRDDELGVDGDGAGRAVAVLDELAGRGGGLGAGVGGQEEGGGDEGAEGAEGQRPRGETAHGRRRWGGGGRGARARSGAKPSLLCRGGAPAIMPPVGVRPVLPVAVAAARDRRRPQ